MRISDWSSDVCSSDLFDLHHTANQEATAANVQQVVAGAGRGAVELQGQLALVQGEIAVDIHHARRKARADIAAVHEQVGVHVALAGQGAALPDPDGTARDGPAGHEGQRGLAIAAADVQLIAGRSEEHTSELQSLMRISYAVFC